FFNFRFPLHAAVEDNDAEMVRILLHFKAKTKLKDASGWSARQLARKRNFNGSHEAVLQILDEYAMARRKRAAARRAAREAKHQTESVCLELEGQAEEEQEDQEPGLLVVLVCDKRLCWTGGKEGNKARQKNDLL
ncbi:ANK_REP_REGION domain-containing protein, partial [Durusdinium trenchii]